MHTCDLHFILFCFVSVIPIYWIVLLLFFFCFVLNISSSSEQCKSTAQHRDGRLTAVEKWWMTAIEMQASQEPLRIGTDRASQTKAWKSFSPQISTRFLLRSQPICNRKCSIKLFVRRIITRLKNDFHLMFPVIESSQSPTKHILVQNKTKSKHKK